MGTVVKILQEGDLSLTYLNAVIVRGIKKHGCKHFKMRCSKRELDNLLSKYCSVNQYPQMFSFDNKGIATYHSNGGTIELLIRSKT